jgi:hypothetical protein
LYYKPGLTAHDVGAKIRKKPQEEGYDLTRDAFTSLQYFKEGGVTHEDFMIRHEVRREFVELRHVRAQPRPRHRDGLDAVLRAARPGLPGLDEGQILKKVQVPPALRRRIVDRARHATRGTGEGAAPRKVDADAELLRVGVELQIDHLPRIHHPQRLREPRFLSRFQHGIPQRGFFTLNASNLRAHAWAAHELLHELIMRLHV